MTDAATDGKETKSKELQLVNLCWGKRKEAFAEEEDVDHEATSAEVKSHFGSVPCLPGPVVHRPKPNKAKEEQVQCCAGTVHHVVLLSHFCSVFSGQFGQCKDASVLTGHLCCSFCP